MRFNPPRVSLPTELNWLLGAAFGPALPPLAGRPAFISELARRFDLGPRIDARHGAVALEQCLGSEAEESIRAHRRGVAVDLVSDRTARRLAALTAGHGMPILFLKGYALQQMLAGPAGWRPYVDLDVLLERPAAEKLRAMLLSDGWTSSTEAANPQHLPPITSPEGTLVDIHYRLRGIQVAAARWATVDELLAAGLCRPAELDGGSWLPRPPLMAAHIAVHALEQHGHRPATYPLLRAVADVADLVAAAEGEDLEEPAGQLIGGSLDNEEIRALFGLAGRFAEGRDSAGEDPGKSDAEILLRHIVAGVLDSDYHDSLALEHTTGRLREARRDGQLMRYIAQKLQDPGGSPEAASGGSARRPGPLRRRLLHLIHLCVRFTTAAAARLRRGSDR